MPRRRLRGFFERCAKMLAAEGRRDELAIHQRRTTGSKDSVRVLNSYASQVADDGGVGHILQRPLKRVNRMSSFLS